MDSNFSDSPKPPEAGSRGRPQHDKMRLSLMRSVVTEPLLSKVRAAVSDPAQSQDFEVIIALNEVYREGAAAAMEQASARAREWNVPFTTVSGYLVATLTASQILKLAEESRNLTKAGGNAASVVYRIWEDTDVSTTLTRSLVTVKADAAQRAFQARGEGIVWGVLDSGIEVHPHFKGVSSQFGPYDALNATAPLAHTDFTPDGAGAAPQTALTDRLGHGTHVAGIIAGYWESSTPEGELVVGTEVRDESTDDSIPQRDSLR